MNVDVDKVLDRTVTVFNRIGARDADSEQDVYEIRVLSPAMWSERVVRSTDASGVSLSSKTTIVQVPSSTMRYLPYAEFVPTRPHDAVTASTGDYVMLGRTSLTGSPTKRQILAELQLHPHLEVHAFRDLSNNGGTEGGPGCLKYANVLHLEGSSGPVR